MAYDISIEMSSNLSADMVRLMVAKTIEEHTGMAVAHVTENIVDGKFEGFQIHFKSQKATGTKSWKPTIWK